MDPAVRYRRPDAHARHDSAWWNPIEAAAPAEWRGLHDMRLDSLFTRVVALADLNAVSSAAKQAEAA